MKLEGTVALRAYTPAQLPSPALSHDDDGEIAWPLDIFEAFVDALAGKSAPRDHAGSVELLVRAKALA